MAKVTPEGGAPFPFKKPIKTKPTPLDGWPQKYLDRKATLGEKTIELKSQRKIAYWIDGQEGVPVLAIHGTMSDKTMWIMPESLPQVKLIAIDRFGHGGSSDEPPNYYFDEAIPEIIEFMDALKIDKFYVTGHSMGGGWALQVAAALGDRVLGVATVSGIADPYHASVSENQRKQYETYSFMKGGQLSTACCGCCGSFQRKLNSYGCGAFPKDKDPGFASYYGMSKKVTGGTRECWGKVDLSPHIVMRICDTRRGNNSDWQDYFETVRQFTKWHYDVSTIKCPVTIYHGKVDPIVKPVAGEMNAAAVPNAKLTLLEEHGHITIFIELPNILLKLIEEPK
eukprot:CAMPEP_0179022010 /NCGR_PEP_ID=MMETSP0796-20121207/6186_1 /TAXON_ID=73915 /ORGANISM="Pyrodinium bahamense, Strain pbaha01" /LENGTH=338 /DNA_ID=CAMNT_0020717861 /DNA_START=35 /DNA_END=1048 /DNA_ORIENTATION=+